MANRKPSQPILLSYQGRVVSGHMSALALVATAATAAGALKTNMLAVAGAFHTSLMSPASDALAKALEDVAIAMPRIPIFSNVTARPLPSSAAEIRSLLARQLVEPVMWEATLQNILSAGEPNNNAPWTTLDV